MKPGKDDQLASGVTCLSKRRSLPYVVYILIFLMIAVFIARVAETYSYLGQAVIVPGVFSDRICYKGSYEMIVCPYTVPPYESLMLILGGSLIACASANAKKK